MNNDPTTLNVRDVDVANDVVSIWASKYKTADLTDNIIFRRDAVSVVHEYTMHLIVDNKPVDNGIEFPFVLMLTLTTGDKIKLCFSDPDERRNLKLMIKGAMCTSYRIE